jgi:hypothetical protein
MEDHSIKYRNCGPDNPWHILLVDGATSHENPYFTIKAVAFNIEIVQFPSHLTHLLQPLDVGCFRTWKHWQQIALMNALRCFTPEYNIRASFRDLPFIRSQMFKSPTIKHAFRDAGMWPVGFQAVQKKVIEYGKKQNKDRRDRRKMSRKSWKPLRFLESMVISICPNSYLPNRMPNIKLLSQLCKSRSITSSLLHHVKYTDVIQYTQIHLSRGAIHESP